MLGYRWLKNCVKAVNDSAADRSVIRPIASAPKSQSMRNTAHDFNGPVEIAETKFKELNPHPHSTRNHCNGHA